MKLLVLAGYIILLSEIVQNGSFTRSRRETSDLSSENRYANQNNRSDLSNIMRKKKRRISKNRNPLLEESLRNKNIQTSVDSEYFMIQQYSSCIYSSTVMQILKTINCSSESGEIEQSIYRSYLPYFEEYEDGSHKYIPKGQPGYDDLNPSSPAGYDFSNYNEKSTIYAQQYAKSVYGPLVQTEIIILRCPKGYNVQSPPVIYQEAKSIYKQTQQVVAIIVKCPEICKRKLIMIRQVATSVYAKLVQQTYIYFDCPRESKPKFLVTSVSESVYYPIIQTGKAFVKI